MNINWQDDLESVLTRIERRSIPPNFEASENQNQQETQRIRSPLIDSVMSRSAHADILFKRLTGFTEEEFNILAKNIFTKKPKINKGAKIQRIEDRFFLVLVFLHTGSTSTLILLTKGFLAGANSVWDIIKKTVEFTLPSASSWLLAPTMEMHPNFKKAVGAIDCTIIPVKHPKQSFQEAAVFFSGKHYRYCAKFQVIVSPVQGLCMSCSPGYPGSVHDYTIFSQTLGNIKKMIGSGALLADSAYIGGIKDIPLYISRPYGTPDISSARVIVERFFGRLKVLFRVFTSVWPLDARLCSSFFQLACMLTNFNIQMHPLTVQDEQMNSRYLQMLQIKKTNTESQRDPTNRAPRIDDTESHEPLHDIILPTSPTGTSTLSTLSPGTFDSSAADASVENELYYYSNQKEAPIGFPPSPSITATPQYNSCNSTKDITYSSITPPNPHSPPSTEASPISPLTSTPVNSILTSPVQNNNSSTSVEVLQPLITSMLQGLLSSPVFGSSLQQDSTSISSLPQRYLPLFSTSPATALFSQSQELPNTQIDNMESLSLPDPLSNNTEKHSSFKPVDNLAPLTDKRENKSSKLRRNLLTIRKRCTKEHQNTRKILSTKLNHRGAYQAKPKVLRHLSNKKIFCGKNNKQTLYSQDENSLESSQQHLSPPPSSSIDAPLELFYTPSQMNKSEPSSP